MELKVFANSHNKITNSYTNSYQFSNPPLTFTIKLNAIKLVLFEYFFIIINNFANKIERRTNEDNQKMDGKRS